jgi:hypothetical protein
VHSSCSGPPQAAARAVLPELPRGGAATPGGLQQQHPANMALLHEGVNPAPQLPLSNGCSLHTRHLKGGRWQPPGRRSAQLPRGRGAPDA